jgi:predicted TIM-barrel fold metal-dependent hydrolase
MNLPLRFAVSKPNVQVPPNACDCHVHVFGPAATYPYAQRRRYTPEDATPEECRTVLDTLGLERLVLVQPSPYGSDHRRMLDALAFFGDRARGIMVWEDAPAGSTLKTLHAAGVRGVRLNFDPRERPRSLEKRLTGIAAAICRLGWHIQMSVAPSFLVDLEPVAERLPVPLVLEHMGRLNAATFRSQPGFSALCNLLRSGRAWVKLSGAYRATGGDDRLQDAGDLAGSLVKANPERVLWGSDWPHTPKHGLEPIQDESAVPFRNIDTALLLDLACRWAGDEKTRETILVRNPERLYGFG